VGLRGLLTGRPAGRGDPVDIGTTRFDIAFRTADFDAQLEQFERIGADVMPSC
jgi:hypothetical protein